VAALPVISGKDCVAALAKLGYRQARQRGSHVRLVCEGRSPVRGSRLRGAAQLAFRASP
jgi:hypothetical protein